MRKRYIVMAVVAGVWGSGCATRSKGAEPGEPGTVTMKAEQNVGTPRVVCVDKKIAVDPHGDGKRFLPPPPWILCEDNKLTVVNKLAASVCLTLLDSDGKNFVPPQSLSPGEKWDNSSLPRDDYSLGVCLQKGGDCLSGCNDMTGSEETPGVSDTIKGNLSVVTSG
ncbi:hypothetical protein [Pyxidicoccus trucidator]|uniref:hypothetical protein n=1 Tax=Pyxidicoccus trucidator TaxID=2709662 RepID=UPI0013DC3BFB|nr:hypothetical protein [Pyxidicoccus trucidator]